MSPWSPPGIGPRCPGRSEPRGIESSGHAPWAWHSTLRSISGFRAILRDLDADVVHLHYPPPITSYFATRSLQRRSVPVCLTYHCDLYLAGAFGGLLAGLYQRVFLPPTLRRVGRIIVHTRSYGVTSTMLRGRELAVIPSVVDLDWFRPGLDASDLRGPLRLEGKRVLGFTGRLVPHKGVDVILQALTDLPEDVVLLVVGAGPVSRAWWVSPGGSGSRNGFASARASATTTCRGTSPSRTSSSFPSQSRLEGFGLAVAEAMAVGLPVVIADMPGVREVIAPGKEGLLAEPLLATDLAAKVRVLLDDPELARRMGAAGRRRAEERYGLATVAHQLLSLYGDLHEAGLSGP